MAKVIEMNNSQQQPTEAEVNAAVERMNAEAGYDVPVAFATMNAMLIQEVSRIALPEWEKKVDLATAVDVVVRAHGGQLTPDGVWMLLDFALAYGWMMVQEEVSLWANEAVKNDLLAYIEQNKTRTVEQNLLRKESLLRGFKALAEARMATEKKLRTAKVVKK